MATIASPAPVLAIAGPTASGKTALALAFARQWARLGPPVEIISVDSALVYRGMDIGTAKPSAAERAEVPHHLIDLIDPAQSYSAARFVQDACALVQAIRARGHLPLLVGGTMLYFKALQDGLDEMPAADPAVRAAIDARAAEQGWPALHAELARVDPVTAARLPVHDAQRIQRALEVWQTSGRPLSAWQQGGQGSHGDGSPGSPSAPGRGQRLPLQLLALEPLQRAWLHQRIAERFDAMLQAGLLEEVAALQARRDLHPGLPSMRCVGYRQAWAALAAGLSMNADAQALASLREQGIAATRQLAKRQLTWLRSMPARDVLACDHPDALQSGIQRLLGLARSLHPC
jgi:tRNA dimethylallyltransferase